MVAEGQDYGESDGCGFLVRLFRYDIPLLTAVNTGPLTLFRRKGWILEVNHEEEGTAAGEAAPLPGFSRETHEEAGAALWKCAHAIARGKETDVSRMPPSVRFAYRQAMSPTLRRKPLWEHEWIPLCALLQGSPEEVLRRARLLSGQGWPAAKLKVGRMPVEEEPAFVRKVRHGLGPNIRLRLDANRAWSMEEALEFTAKVAGDAGDGLAPLDFLEEPLKNCKKIPSLARRSKIPLALDETLQEVYGPVQLSGDEALKEVRPLLDAVAVWVWKPTLCGPFNPAYKAQMTPGTRLVPSAAYESGVGISGIISMAAFPGDVSVAPAGVDTHRLLEHDTVFDPEGRFDTSRPRVAWEDIRQGGTLIADRMMDLAYGR